MHAPPHIRTLALAKVLALAAFALAGELTAQVVPLASSGGFGVQAGSSSSWTLSGADITAGSHLMVGASSGAAQFHYSPAWNSAFVDLSWTATSTAFAYTSASSGGSTRHELWSARPVDGRFVLTWLPTTTGTGAASFGFDLFDDGLVDASNSAVIPFTLPAGPTVFRVHLSTSAAAGVINGPWGSQIHYQGTATGALLIRFEPTHCAVATFAAACGGGPATMVVGNLLGGVDVAAQGTVGDDIAIAVFGFDQLATGLPLPPGCWLRTTPVVSLWRGLTAANEANWSLALPIGIGPVSFAAQAVAIDVDTWRATTGPAFWITCH